MRKFDPTFNPRPVEHIELPEGNTRPRWIIVAALLVVATIAFGVGLSGVLNREGGWTDVEALSGAPGCAAEFSLQYCLPDKGGRAVLREVSALYTSACTRAAQVYSAEEDFDGVGNVHSINAKPNEIVTVEPELYAALQLVQQTGNRAVYLAPLYETYLSLFFCEDDAETADYDPLQNPELAESFRELAAFANDPEQIDLELLGGRQVRLRVAPAYLQYAQENGVGCFFDFGWMKNAFIADDLASALKAQGFTDAVLQSVDGFGCNLSERGDRFAMQIFDGVPKLVAEMEYAKPLSFVSMHSRSIHPGDRDWYYEFESGEVRAIYLDPADGMPKTAIDDLLLWSGKLGCGALVLRACEAYLTDAFDPAALDVPELFCAYCEQNKLYCSDPDVQFPELLDGYQEVTP